MKVFDKKEFSLLRQNLFIRDLITIGLLIIPLFLFSAENDVLEQIFEFTRKYEQYELDEWISILMILPIGFLFFSCRRWREYKCMSTELAKVNQHLQEISLLDELTGLINRRAFIRVAEKQVGIAGLNHKSVTFMFLDLDRFKLINDTLGHNVGDILLQEVGKRLGNSLRKEDTIARIGGDEFMLMFPNCDQNDSERLVWRVKEAFSKPFRIESDILDISPSIGISIYPFDGDSVEKLIEHADIAMYEAKKNCTYYEVFTSELASNISYKQGVESDLQKALEINEFYIEYQPIIDIQSKKIISVEALLRWKHRKEGIIAPLDFIPLAERTGSIVAIGEWVLRQACSQNKAWQMAGLKPIKVTVNISFKQISHHDFVKTVADILGETKLASEYLVLEVSESIAISKIEQLRDNLISLRRMGVHISIDNFASHYVPLIDPDGLSFDSLKIDSAFMSKISSSSKDEILVSNLIGIAHNLKLSVIAKGVENKGELKFLEDNHCDSVQGYLVSKPVSAKEITSLL